MVYTEGDVVIECQWSNCLQATQNEYCSHLGKEKHVIALASTPPPYWVSAPILACCFFNDIVGRDLHLMLPMSAGILLLY